MPVIQCSIHSYINSIVMKKLLLLSLTGLFFFSFSARSQDCVSFFPTEKGKKLVYQYYNNKSKPVIKTYYEVKEVEKSDKGLKITARQWMENSEGQMVDTFLLDYYCKDGEFYIDMKSSLSSLLDKYEGMDLEVNTKDLALPGQMKEGDVLPDGQATVVVRNNGVKVATASNRISNRKVEGNEKVTTPAGTFDCVKISYTVEGKVGFVKSHGRGAVWYAKGIGSVKTENYNKKGKLESWSELVKVE